MLCLMWEYLQQSQNACSVSSALHQLTGTLLIRKRTEGIRVGGKVEEEEGGRRREWREGGGGGGETVCTSIYTPSSIHFDLTGELSVFHLLSLCLWLYLVTSGVFSLRDK